MLRDFLYLDNDRVRSLLAQLDGGVVDQVVEKVKTTASGEGGSRVFGLFDLRGSLARESAAEQTRSMQDALYVVFEQAADELSLITSLPLDTPAIWRSGVVHEGLTEGQLVRCQAPTRIIDARLFRERTVRFMDWALAAERLTNTDSDSPRPDEDLVAEVESELAHVRHIGALYSLMMADQISIRQFPFGEAESDVCVAGTLLSRPGFLQDERESLFGKYGSAVSTWSMVGQVATLPKPNASAALLPREIDAENAGSARRMFFEEMAVYGMRTFEEQGFAEAPAFPAIHVTPLAVYREVPLG